MQKSVLGKGLSALIPQGESGYSAEQVAQIPINEICLNPKQPRRKFEEDKIHELACSIKEFGILQPVIITRKDGLYHLVVGERRLRAAKWLGMERIPAIIKDFNWDNMLMAALVENLQREDLRPLEEARAYSVLVEEYGLTQDQVADSICRSRPYVANSIRLLNLPQKVQEYLDQGDLTQGHARALLAIGDEKLMIFAAESIIKDNLSVRQAEEMARQAKEKKEKGQKKKTQIQLPPSYRHIQDRLMERFSTRVAIRKSGGEKSEKGKIEIHFNSGEELERIITALGGDEEWV